jgi:DNA repair protein RecN (Recombination protein N)
MLEELTIRDFALIERVHVPFKPGLTLFTGETGAGKSILIGAIGFLLGGKADTGLIRSGAEEALVSGVFSLEDSPLAAAWLDERGIAFEESTVIVRRSLRANGRGSIYVQDTPITRADLAVLSSHLIDMHGQREHQSLLKSERHRETLDGFCGLGSELSSYSQKFADLVRKRKDFEQMVASEAERAREIDFLKYAIEEIARVNPRIGEDVELEQEEARLSQFEKLSAGIEALRSALSEPQVGALSMLRKARTAAEGASSIDSSIAGATKRLEDAYYELEDVAEDVRHYAESVSFSPERLQSVESRLSELAKLKKKYGGSVEEALQRLEESSSQLERLENWEGDREVLAAEIAASEREVYSMALAISEKRRAGAERLQSSVEAVVRTLGMANARFRIDCRRKDGDGGKAVVGQFGIDEVRFAFCANLGEPLRALDEIASGGELSRVMLAVKTAIADSDGIPTLIFDEVDTGIGGEVALAVGQHLAGLSEKRQVLCVTHLASIAARADNHYRVEKDSSGGRTVTKVRALAPDEREGEIARMLAGDSTGERSLAHAKELVMKLGRRS